MKKVESLKSQKLIKKQKKTKKNATVIFTGSVNSNNTINNIVQNLTLNVTKVENNLSYDKANTFLINGKLVDRNSQRIVLNEKGIEPSLNLLFDGAILEAKEGEKFDKIINGTALRAYRNEILFDPEYKINPENNKKFTLTQIENGARFYLGLAQITEKIKSVDLAWDLSPGTIYHDDFFKEATLCLKKLAVVSFLKKSLSFVDSNSNTFILKKKSIKLSPGLYLAKENEKGDFQIVEKAPFPIENVGMCQTFYAGLNKGKQSKLKIYSKYTKTSLEEHKAIIRIELTAREKEDLDLIERFNKDLVTKEEMTRELFKKYFEKDLEFKKASSKSKISNKYKSAIAPFWKTFRKKIVDATFNMENIDAHVVKATKKRLKERPLFIEKEKIM